MSDALAIPGYQIERMLARGGMAEVYLAEQTSLGRKVAIKVLDQKATDVEFSTRFLQEAKLVASLNHANLITIFDFGKLADNRLYLVMELLTGGDLEERLKQRIPEESALRIMRQLASVLHFVHKKGIVHRDVKPANILFRDDGTLVLTDFGIAKKIDNNVGLTQAGMMVGSPAYSSPEQVQGLEIDQRADIYSAGVVFLELLTGSNPFKADSFIDTAIKHSQMEVPRLAGNLGRFQFMIDKMLAKKPKDRYSNLDDVVALLDKVMEHLAINHRNSGQQPAIQGTSHYNVSTPAHPVVTEKLHSQPVNSKIPAESLDDLLDEELKHMEDELFADLPRTVRPTPARPIHTPPPAPIKKHNGSFRTRPLPRNLLDDEDEI